MSQIEATIGVTIEHYKGPAIEDADHVRRWICADGAWMDGMRNGFTFEVCPDHADPDECASPCDTDVAIFKATIVYADR